MTSIYIWEHRCISGEHYSHPLPSPTTQDMYWSIPSFVHQQMTSQTDWCLDTMAVMKPKFFDFFISSALLPIQEPAEEPVQEMKLSFFQENACLGFGVALFQPSLIWSRTQSLTLSAKISSSATSAWFVSLSGRGQAGKRRTLSKWPWEIWAQQKDAEEVIFWWATSIYFLRVPLNGPLEVTVCLRLCSSLPYFISLRILKTTSNTEILFLILQMRRLRLREVT